MSFQTVSSIESDEIAHFSQHAEDWWNPEGKFRPLHRLNPIRVEYVRDQVCAHFERASAQRQALKDFKILDIGCGGGLMAEPLARMGARVTAIDASAETIAVAKKHAKLSGLSIDYRLSSVEELVAKKQSYDVVTALEVVEHVADMPSFMASVSAVLKPNGLLIMSTLNRTPKSFLLGVVAAEYVLGWVPRGTHQWKKFVRPSELVQQLDEVGIRTTNLAGLTFNPLRGEFELRQDDLAVNYMLAAVRGRL